MFSIFNTIKQKFHPLKTRARLIKKSWKWQTADIIFIGTMLFAALALFALLWYNVRPIKTVDIKVPVATDRSAYAPGEEIGGIFFGEIFYEGDVKVLREVYCRDYKAVIPPPEGAKNGDFYDTQSIPRKLDGLSVTVGKLPDNIPIGKNCILQFTNVYDIPTPFGTRHISVSYYTQNFAIISQERRQILECEAQGRTNCNTEITPEQSELQNTTVSPDNTTSSNFDPATPESPLQPRQSAQTTQPTQSSNSAPSEPETAPNEPVQPERTCAIDFLGIKLFCS